MSTTPCPLTAIQAQQELVLPRTPAGYFEILGEIDTGFLLAPRGIGVMVSMALVGRIVGRIDARMLIGAGLALAALSMWEMSRFSLDVTP